MKTRAVILAGGEGSRLGILTAKRTKPAVPFAGKYRIIDFALSNCINSNIFDAMILAQYRPQSLIEHIGAGGPWDLDRDFTGGLRIYTPYKARGNSDWFTGTADALQQNFIFIKKGDPDLIVILSGDHIYAMDYEQMITFHMDHHADLTLATIQVPLDEASRFGIVGVGPDYRVDAFVEKPANPPSNQANMGVYIFNIKVLDTALWEDHLKVDSNHDFGKDIIPQLIANGSRVFAYPYSGYWIDVGTPGSYWQAHMDLLKHPPSIDLNNRSWIIHTRTEERPPAFIAQGAQVETSMVSGGCVIEPGARVSRSILSPGVRVAAGAVVDESIVLTDTLIEAGAVVYRSILDKKVVIGQNAHIGAPSHAVVPILTMVGKSSIVPENAVLEPGAVIGTDVVPSDFPSLNIKVGQAIQTRRLPYEV